MRAPSRLASASRCSATTIMQISTQPKTTISRSGTISRNSVAARPRRALREPGRGLSMGVPRRTLKVQVANLQLNPEEPQKHNHGRHSHGKRVGHSQLAALRRDIGVLSDFLFVAALLLALGSQLSGRRLAGDDLADRPEDPNQ